MTTEIVRELYKAHFRKHANKLTLTFILNLINHHKLLLFRFCYCQLPRLVKFQEAAWQAFEGGEHQYDAKRQKCTEHSQHHKTIIVKATRIITFHTVDNRQLDEGEESSKLAEGKDHPLGLVWKAQLNS